MNKWPLFTLGSVYSTKADGAEQSKYLKQILYDDVSISIQIHNKVKNPNWQEENQLAIYKRGRGVELTRVYRETIPASGNSGT